MACSVFPLCVTDMKAKLPKIPNIKNIYISGSIYTWCAVLQCLSELKVLPDDEPEASTEGPVPSAKIPWLPITQSQ